MKVGSQPIEESLSVVELLFDFTTNCRRYAQILYTIQPDLGNVEYMTRDGLWNDGMNHASLLYNVLYFAPFL